VLTLGASLQELTRLYPWLDEAAREDALPPKLLHRLHVTLEEAVVNVAMHAYPPGEAGSVTIEYVSDAEAVSLMVKDFGVPFDPTAEAVGGETPEIGGKGLILLRHFCPDVSYRRDGEENQLSLRFPRG
jgi:anti-sigma regulatory factor (Ser/Thr protein kinase)